MKPSKLRSTKRLNPYLSQSRVGLRSSRLHLKTKRFKTSNVIGIIEGEGPNADETIVIGGHYDHLGDGAYGSRAGGRREIHNGATTMRLEPPRLSNWLVDLTKAVKSQAVDSYSFALRQKKWGSWELFTMSKTQSYRWKKTVAMINFDMIGWLRNDRLTLYGLEFLG